MRVLAHPLARDPLGRLVTIDDETDAGARQLAAHVLSTVQGERPLAPTWGIPDQPGRADVDLDVLAAAVEDSEPDLQVTSITAGLDATGAARAVVQVTWAPVDPGWETDDSGAADDQLDQGDP